MKPLKLLTACVAGMTASLPTLASVQALTSDEMVETYVKDSAVIIVPKKQQKSEADRRRIIRALTISPGEPVLTEAEEEAYREALQRYIEEGRKSGGICGHLPVFPRWKRALWMYRQGWSMRFRWRRLCNPSPACCGG